MIAIAKRLMFAGFVAVAFCAVAAQSGGSGKASATLKAADVAYGRMSELPFNYRAAAGDADGYTNCWFTIDTSFTHGTEVLDDAPNSKRVRITIRTAHADLGMKTTVWLREQPAAWLVAHEQGHRQIGERCYAGADKVVVPIAKQLVGHTYTATGSTVAGAESAARAQAGRELTQAYLSAVAKFDRIHQIYDDLTSHGKNRAVTEESAINDAFARFGAGRR